jgi:4-hydroxybenzoate polyprenyltransferase
MWLAFLYIVSITKGACALFPVFMYPAAKRFTHWPQAVLGIVFNWGALMGWSAVICSSPAYSQTILSFLPVLPLYLGNI